MEPQEPSAAPAVLIAQHASTRTNDAVDVFIDSLPEALSAVSARRVVVDGGTEEVIEQLTPFTRTEHRLVVVWLGDTDEEGAEGEVSLTSVAAALTSEQLLPGFHVVRPVEATGSFRVATLLHGHRTDTLRLQGATSRSNGSSLGAELPPVNGILTMNGSINEYSLWDVYGVGTGTTPFDGTAPLAVVICANAGASANHNMIVRGYEYWFWFKKLGNTSLPGKWPTADFELVPRGATTMSTRTALVTMAGESNHVDYQVFPEGTLPSSPTNFSYTPSGGDRVYKITKRYRTADQPYATVMGYLVYESAATPRLHWVIDRPSSTSRIDSKYYHSLRFTDVTSAGTVTASAHHVLAVSKHAGLP